MDREEALVLVPGLFGFDAFGAGPEQISYFDQVKALLARFLDLDEARIIVHRPAPTGALAWRVKSLYELASTIAHKGLPGGGRADRIHFVGHSTGGVDVRLLLNPRYEWPGSPAPSERVAFFRQVGAVISLSAPQRGTPIARRLRGTMEGVLSELYLLSILAKRGSLDLKKQLMLLYHSIMQMFGGEASRGPLRFLASLPPEVAAQVSAFLSNIVRDHALIHDLTPFAMARLNEAIGGSDWKNIRFFVGVAPAPRLRTALLAGLDLEELQWAIYATSYWAAHPAEGEIAAFPTGSWIGGKARAELVSPKASDGVVPAASQTLDGVAAAIVAGDHLDVVGHFASKRFHGTTAFKSGAEFDDERFDELWRAIANEISLSRTG